MNASKNASSRLNPVQQSLLRLFSRPMTEDETLQLKRILVQHFGGQLRDELEKLTSEKGYTNPDFDKMLMGKS